jgi:hypothetical protein
VTNKDHLKCDKLYSNFQKWLYIAVSIYLCCSPGIYFHLLPLIYSLSFSGHILQIGHTAPWCSVINLTTNNITTVVFLHLLLLSVLQNKNNELWLVLIPDYGSKKHNILTILHMFKWSAQTNGRTWND